jgi:hypothetical protein
MATPAELLVLFREDVDDVDGGVGGADYLWSDSEFYRYLNSAHLAFVERTEILKTATITALIDIAVTADDPIVTPSPLVLHPTRAKLLLGTHPLKIVPFEELDESGLLNNDYGFSFASNWETVTGTPRCLITNWDDTVWRLAPTPLVNDTLRLITTHLPQTEIKTATEDDAIAVTDIEHQTIMLDYAKHLAYRKQDADVYDIQLSNAFMASFLRDAEKIKTQLKRKRHQSQPVRYGGIPLS